MAGRRTGERGAALLVVVVSVAVLTALAVDLSYEATVTLRIAANARDELRATAAARGGVGLARLVISLQRQLDDQVPPGLAMPRPIVWRLLPVDSTLASGLFESGGRTGPSVDFHADIDDEAGKASAQLDGLGQGGLLGAQVEAFYRLVCDPRWDPLFDREDEKGNRVSRQDLLVYLHDFVDAREESTALSAQFPQGTCEILLPPRDPFEPAGGDKNQPYDREPGRYRTKNARMDSLDELYLVAGIGDAFMAAFGDSLTVYLPRSAKRNVNDVDRERLVESASLIASPKIQAALLDPAFAEALQNAVLERTFGGVFALTPKDFGAIVAALGVTVDPNLLAESGPLTDRSSTFRIRATATAGAVEKQLDVVVRLDGAQGAAAVPGQLALGRPVHWREE